MPRPSDPRTTPSGSTQPYTSAEYTEEAPTTGSERPSGARPVKAPAKKSGVVFIVVLAVIVAFVAWLGWAAFLHKSPQRARPHPAAAATPVAKPAPATTAAADSGEALLMGGPAKASTAAPAAIPAPATTAPLVTPAVSTTAPALPAPVAAGSVLSPAASVAVASTAALPVVQPIVPTASAPAMPVTLAPAAVPVTVPPVATTPVTGTLPTQTPAPAQVPAPAAVTPIVPAAVAPAPGAVGADPIVQGRIHTLEMRMTTLEDGQAKILAMLQGMKDGKVSVKPVSPVKASTPVRPTSVDRPVRRAVSHNHVELIQPKPVASAPVTKAVPQGCKLASIVPSRAWIKQADGSFLTYGVGDEAPNGSTIKSIDPDQGIVTERGKLNCSQGE